MSSTAIRVEPPYQINLAAIFQLNYTGSRIFMGTVNDQLPHKMDIVGSDWFGESELSSEDWWDADLVRIDIHVWRDDRTGGVVDSLPLQGLWISALPS